MLSPDTSSLTRLMVWAGVALCVLAFALPAFVFRNTDVLTISQKELAGLTPSAARELERRQHVSGDVARWSPLWGGALLVAGVVLLRLAVPRLSAREQADIGRQDDERRRHRAETEALIASLPRQTTEEQVNAATEGDVGDNESGAEGDSPGEQAPLQLRDTVARLTDARDFEERVLLQLQAETPSTYSLQTRPALRSGEAVVAPDALLLSRVPDLPDVLIEIKHVRGHASDAVHRSSEQAKSLAIATAVATGRDTVAWVILAGVPTQDSESFRIAPAGVLVTRLAEVEAVPSLRFPPVEVLAGLLAEYPF